MKIRKIDSKGNIIIGSTAILVAALILMCIFTIASINYIQNANIDSQANDNFKYVIDDYSANVELLGREAIAQATEKVYNGLPILDSRDEIKKNLDEELIIKNQEFEKKYGIKISSKTLSVENTDSPWVVLFKVRVTGEKGSEKFSQIIEKNASIEGLRDPLPIAKLTIISGVMAYDGEIHYKHICFFTTLNRLNPI